MQTWNLEFFLFLSPRPGLLNRKLLWAVAVKLFSCSTQLSLKFNMLISINISRNTVFSGSDKLIMLFLLLIHVKMPTISTFTSRKNHVQLS